LLLKPWLDMRREFPVDPLLCIINGETVHARRAPMIPVSASLRL
jgi:hypothetical protein